MNFTFFSNDLIGDALMQTPALASLKAINKGATITMQVLENSLAHHVFKNCDVVDKIEIVTDNPGSKALSCVEAFNYGSKTRTSMIDGFGAQLGIPLCTRAISYNPLKVSLANHFGLTPGKYVLIARHSTSCSSRTGSVLPNKCFGNGTWLKVADYLAEQGYTPVAIGAKSDAEELRFKDWKDYPTIYGEDLTTVANLIRESAAVLCVETGVRFMASALGANYMCIACATPSWLVSCGNVERNQKSYELNINIMEVDNTISQILPLIGSLLE